LVSAAPCRHVMQWHPPPPSGAHSHCKTRGGRARELALTGQMAAQTKPQVGGWVAAQPARTQEGTASMPCCAFPHQFLGMARSRAAKSVVGAPSPGSLLARSTCARECECTCFAACWLHPNRRGHGSEANKLSRVEWQGILAASLLLCVPLHTTPHGCPSPQPTERFLASSTTRLCTQNSATSARGMRRFLLLLQGGSGQGRVEEEALHGLQGRTWRGGAALTGQVERA